MFATSDCPLLPVVTPRITGPIPFESFRQPIREVYMAMSDTDRLIKGRLMVLTFAAELHNVVKACKLAGISRSQFYAIKKAYEAYGKEGLLPRVRRKPTMPNRTPQHVEQKILLVTRKKPMSSYIRVADEIKSEGTDVTHSMVRYVWRRHGLSTRSARMKWVRTTLGDANHEKMRAIPRPSLRTIASGSKTSANTTEGRKPVGGLDFGHTDGR